jgi:hypothetical protein
MQETEDISLVLRGEEGGLLEIPVDRRFVERNLTFGGGNCRFCT